MWQVTRVVQYLHKIYCRNVNAAGNTDGKFLIKPTISKIIQFHVFLFVRSLQFLFSLERVRVSQLRSIHFKCGKIKFCSGLSWAKKNKHWIITDSPVFFPYHNLITHSLLSSLLLIIWCLTQHGVCRRRDTVKDDERVRWLRAFWNVFGITIEAHVRNDEHTICSFTRIHSM